MWVVIKTLLLLMCVYSNLTSAYATESLKEEDGFDDSTQYLVQRLKQSSLNEKDQEKSAVSLLSLSQPPNYEVDHKLFLYMCCVNKIEFTIKIFSILEYEDTSQNTDLMFQISIPKFFSFPKSILLQCSQVCRAWALLTKQIKTEDCKNTLSRYKIFLQENLHKMIEPDTGEAQLILDQMTQSLRHLEQNYKFSFES